MTNWLCVNRITYRNTVRAVRGKRKDRAVRDKFPDAEIYTLLGEQKLTKGEKVIDNVLGILTDAPFGIPGLINSVKTRINSFIWWKETASSFLLP